VGVAHTAAQNGEREKAETRYAHFLRQWQPADGQLTELREAHAYGQQASTQ
jgi:hypothetical protein